MKVEKWDLFDKDDNPRGTFIRGIGMIPDGLYHKTVEVLPSDMEGYLLLTRRSMNKKIGGGQLEFPAGSVISGETEEQAALRELKEETGLRPAKLFFLQKARTPGMIRYTYFAYIPDMREKEIRYAPSEISNHIFVTFNKWQELLVSQEYNAFRRDCYNEKLFAIIQKLTNRHYEEPQPEHMPSTTLRASNALATKKPRHLDKRCYEEDDTPPPGYLEEEPPFEQGDDGT